MKTPLNEELRRDISDVSQSSIDDRTIELSFCSEDPYMRSFGPEILESTNAAVDLSRLEQIGVLLFNHDPNQVIGKIQKVWIDEILRKGKAIVQFDTDDESERIYQKVKFGTLKGVSVGYSVSVWEDVNPGAVSVDGRFKGECYIARKWQPYEVSIVSIPADASVGVGRSVGPFEPQMQMEQWTEEPTIEPSINKNSNEDTLEVEQMEKTINEQEVREAAIKAEQKRAADILAMGKQYGVEVTDLVSRGASIDDAKSFIIDALAKQTVKTTAVTTDTNVRAAIEDGLALRAGVKLDKVAPGAHDYRNMSLVEVAKSLLEVNGENTRLMNSMEVARRSFTASADLPQILLNVANKVLVNAYEQAATTYQEFVKITSAQDFKDMYRVKLSELPEVVEIEEGDEYPELKFSDDKEVYKVKTYGGVVVFTRQAIVNDDLGALLRTPIALGDSIARTLNKMVFSVLSGSHLMADGKELFCADHGNVSASAMALTLKNISAAKTAMRKQTGPKGSVLNIEPTFLIVPPELEFEAKQLIASTVDPTKNNATINPLAGSLKIIVDSALTDAKTWYLAANPNQIDTIECAFLHGVQTPYIENKVEFDNDVIKTKARIDFGVKAIDYRGLFKALGA